jgi:tetratricopeptide (TPR) repeat protein
MRKAILLCVFALAAFGQQGAPDPQQLVREGIALFDAGRFDEAITKYKEALAVDPKNTLIAYELSLAYAQKGDFAACRSTLQPIVSVPGPAQIEALVTLGNCLDSVGERKKAIDIYRRALKIAPNDPRVEYELGLVLLADRKLADAREMLKKDVTARPAHVNGRYALAMAFESDNFRVPATFEFLHFLALDPTSSRAVEAAKHFRALLDLGVEQKDNKNINVTVDTHARTEEGDYGAMAMMLALMSAGRFTDEEAKKSEFEQVQGQLGSVIAMFIETPAEQRDYTARAHRRFFESMQQEKLVDAYVAVALSTLQLPGTKEWAAQHGAEIDRFMTWMQPQLGKKPAGEMPVPPR